MKKGIGMFVLVCCLLAGCGGSDRDFDRIESKMVSDDVTTVSVTHIVGGQMTEWVVNRDAVEAFRIWMNGLECRQEQFEDGNTPGDSDGGEVYSFVFDEEENSEISYIINGPNDCYLLVEGEWYVVKNPSNPPVMESEDARTAGIGEGRTQWENDAEVETGRDAGAGQDEDAETAGHPENGEEAEAGQEDEWGLALRAESVSATGCTIVFIQHGGTPTGELTSGTWYRIEKKEGDEWVEMPYAQGIGDEIGWHAVAWCIPDEGSVSFEENWGFLYGELPSGIYRIVKEIMDFRSSGDYDKKWYYAEFSVTEERVSVRSEKPPLLTVISDEAAHDALLGTYSWWYENGDGISADMEVDHAHPLDCEAWLPPLETTCQTVVLHFAEEPDRIVSIRCWSDESWSDPTAESEDITVMGNEIELKIGGYIYEVTAEWNTENGFGGRAYYSFYVKLSE